MTENAKPMKVFMWPEFAEEVRAKRARINIHQRELSRRLSLTPATMCRAEQGKPISVDTVFAICGWLEIEPKDFWKTANSDGVCDGPTRRPTRC